MASVSNLAEPGILHIPEKQVQGQDVRVHSDCVLSADWSDQ